MVTQLLVINSKLAFKSQYEKEEFNDLALYRTLNKLNCLHLHHLSNPNLAASTVWNELKPVNTELNRST